MDCQKVSATAHVVSEIEYQDFNDPVLDNIITKAMKEFHTPGLAVLVVHDGKICAKGYGYSDLEQRMPVTPKTMFFTGSTTKSFTCSMAAHLVESADHAVSWQTPLADLIKEDFVLDQSTPEGRWATTHVTLEDALSHRSGLGRHELAWINGFTSIRDIVRSLRYLPVRKALRAAWGYCNNTYTAVAHAIETVLGQPLRVLLKTHIFDPLGMMYTTYDLADALKISEKFPEARMSRGYLWNAQTSKHKLVPWDDIPPARGSGGIISNVLDYAKWVQHLMEPRGLTPALSEAAVRRLRKPTVVVEPDPRKPYVGPQAYCLGLYSKVYRGRELIKHSGAIAGYMSNMVMIPPTKTEVEAGETSGGWAVVVMQNTYSPAHRVAIWHLLDDYLQTPEIERFDVAKTSREEQLEREEWLKPANAIQRMFGEESAIPHESLALPLQSYVGVYRHPAYHDLTVSLPPKGPKLQESIQPDPNQYRGDQEDRIGGGSAGPITLHLGPSEKAKTYLAYSATLHHVFGEWWWAHQRTGPGNWVNDNTLKVRFVLDPDGAVRGMRYQADPSMPEELAFFERLA